VLEGASRRRHHNSLTNAPANAATPLSGFIGERIDACSADVDRTRCTAESTPSHAAGQSLRDWHEAGLIEKRESGAMCDAEVNRAERVLDNTGALGRPPRMWALWALQPRSAASSPASMRRLRSRPTRGEVDGEDAADLHRRPHGFGRRADQVREVLELTDVLVLDPDHLIEEVHCCLGQRIGP
jgi:hypothetical protein